MDLLHNQLSTPQNASVYVTIKPPDENETAIMIVILLF